jgi:predicted dehydrogenase
MAPLNRIGSLQLTLSPPATPTLRGALVGYGFIGAGGHLPAYLERAQRLGDVAITAVADVSEARRSLAQRVLPEARIYDSAEALLDAEAGRLDFLDIATPPCDHARIAHAALDAGLHVLCEKPLTTTLDDARALLEHAQRARRVLFPCHNYKHAPVVRAVSEAIASGRLGRVRSVDLLTFRNTHAKGVTEWNTHWRRFHRWSGGGIAMDHGSHTLYLAFEWMGAYPSAVAATMANFEPGRFDTEDNLSLALTFPNGLAHASLSWTAGMRKVIYSVQGDAGGLVVDDDELEVALQRRTDGPDVAQGAVAWDAERRSIASHWGDASHTTWFDALFSQFRQAIREGDFVSREAVEAYRCIEVITRAYESARSGSRELALAGPPPSLAAAIG